MTSFCAVIRERRTRTGRPGLAGRPGIVLTDRFDVRWALRVFVFGVMFGVNLARLGGVMRRMRGVAGGDMGVMPGRLGIAVRVVLGGFAMMTGGVFVMVGRVGVVLVSVVR
jgi:hypothetical protein